MNREHSGPLRTFGPAAAVVVALLAIVAAYSSTRQAAPGPEKRRARDSPAVAFAAFDTRWPLEQGPLEQPWQWMDREVSVRTPAVGRYYLAFRAASLRGSPSLRAERGSVRLTPNPRAYLLDLATLRPGDEKRLVTDQRPRRVSRADRRRVSIFLSSPALFRAPLAVLPGSGFYALEKGVRSVPFAWLRDSGRLDFVSSRARPARGWASVQLRSPLPRRVQILGSGRPRKVLLTPNRPIRVVLGPVSISGGQGRVRLRATPPGRRVGRDRRRLGVQVTLLSTSLGSSGRP